MTINFFQPFAPDPTRHPQLFGHKPQPTNKPTNEDLCRLVEAVTKDYMTATKAIHSEFLALKQAWTHDWNLGDEDRIMEVQSCISAYRLCTICTSNLTNIQSCTANVCAGQRSFAAAYFRSICAADTYMSGRALVSVSGGCKPADDKASLMVQESQIKLGGRRAKHKTRTALQQS
ncbi:hypothetical protein MMC30_008866 [Trapelia coarctata]|nr:hypothetical protein [Trapelia coarctata]